jgi:hypothetical protein
MSIEEIAKHFGLPGFMLFIWYLYGRAQNARLEKAEEKRMEIEEKKVAAMTIGFQTLGAGLVNVRETVARLDEKVDTLIDMGDRFTPPPQEIPRGTRARTNPEGVPIGAIGTYGPKRGGRDG